MLAKNGSRARQPCSRTLSVRLVDMKEGTPDCVSYSMSVSMRCRAYTAALSKKVTLLHTEEGAALNVNFQPMVFRMGFYYFEKPPRR